MFRVRSNISSGFLPFKTRNNKDLEDSVVAFRGQLSVGHEQNSSLPGLFRAVVTKIHT